MDNIEDRNFYSDVIHKFLMHLRDSLQKLDNNVTKKIKYSISRKLFCLMDIHVGYFALANALVKIFFPLKEKSYKIRRIFRKLLKKIGINNTSLPMMEEMIPNLFLDIISQSNDENLRLLSEAIVKIKFHQLEEALKNTKEFNAVEGKKCIVINSLFTPSWAPTFQALEKNGWKCAAVLRSDLKESSSYAASITKEIPTTYKYILDLFGALVFIAKANNYPILLSGEAYHHANWNAEDAIILYSIMSCFAKTIRTCYPEKNNYLHYLMYDGLKPISTCAPALASYLSIFYQEYMQSVAKIIYNSNKEIFGDFIENAYGVKARRIHFVRFSEKPKNPKPRLSFGENNDEYHMVCITTCLDNNLDALRSSRSGAFLRSILHQGIHFHYYNIEAKTTLQTFLDTVDPIYQRFFHSHPINRNQEELVDELSQYHIGLHPADQFLMLKAITSTSDEKYQDAMRRYIQSTCPTSLMTYMAAGLPIVSVLDGYHLSPETMFYFTFSDFKNLKNHLNKINLVELCKKADEVKHTTHIEKHIDRLINFMES